MIRSKPRRTRVDGILSYFLKLAMPLIENYLVLIVNKSLGNAEVRDSLKASRVTPIYKDGEEDRGKASLSFRTRGTKIWKDLPGPIISRSSILL